MTIEIKLANPRGFCAGVDRAIEIVNRALDIHGAPIYVRHEVVHNKTVVNSLRERGAVFVDELDEVPEDSYVIFSAHGVSQAVKKEAVSRELEVYDATCPLVTKVHMEVAKYSRKGQECVLIGHAGHPEVEGTMGQYDHSFGGDIYLVEDEADVAQLEVDDPSSLAYVSQTTLSVDDTAKIIDCLRQKFPEIHGPRKDDICYATQNRQDAVKQLALECDLVLVVGSPNSSNSNRLKELAERCGTRSYLIDDASDIDPSWLRSGLPLRGNNRQNLQKMSLQKSSQISAIGITAGASAPESLVKEVVEKLQDLGALAPEELTGKEENIRFSLPRALTQ